MIDELFVPGRPRTKGSLKVITPRGQKPRLIEDHKHSKPWRQHIAAHLKQAGYAGIAYPGPVTLYAGFIFERHGATAHRLTWPTLSAGVNAHGDLDKLLRNLLDALEDAQVILNDEQVCRVRTSKTFGSQAGLLISVYALPNPS